MRIAIDVSRANGDVLTGVERYTFEVARRLIQHPEHDWALLAPRPPHARWRGIVPGGVWRTLTWPFGIGWTSLRLRPALNSFRPDITFFPASAIPPNVTGTIVTTIHDLAFFHVPGAYERPMPGLTGWRGRVGTILSPIFGVPVVRNEGEYQRWALQQALTRSARIIAVSQATATDLQSHNQRHIPIDVIPLGVDQRSAPTSVESRAHDRPYFLYIGRLEQKKNLAVLLAAYRRYREQHPDGYDLVLAGHPTAEWQEIQQGFAVDWLQKYVRILGEVTEQQRQDLLHQSSGLLLVSSYEGFGLPVLEAMQAGIPVICTPVGALPEMAKNIALFVEPRNEAQIAAAMQTVSQSGSDLGDRIKLGVERSKQYTWELTAERTLVSLLRAASLKDVSKNGMVNGDE